tara:strand:+ start:217 stop:1512 length:1296 start_codon:yes stop_codon:yes gene_type:complete
MARNRVIYQSEALYVSRTDETANKKGCQVNQGIDSLAGSVTPTAGERPKYIQRVQNANYSFSIERQDVNQFGNLAAIDRIILSSPTVSLDFQYLVGNLANEDTLGFKVNTVNTATASLVSAISKILDKTGDEKCYYIKTVDEGLDERDVARAASASVIGLGNGYITSYSTEGSVGNFPTVSVNVEALNMKVYDAASGHIPAVTQSTGVANSTNFFQLPAGADNANTATGKHALPSTVTDGQISVLRPGDISFSFQHKASLGGSYTTWGSTNATASNNSASGTLSDGNHVAGPNMSQAANDTDVAAKLQSYNISFDISRTPLEKLGSKFAFSREIDFPVTVSMSIEAMVADMKKGGLDQLVADDGFFHLNVDLNKPGTSTLVAGYHLIGAKLDSQEFSSGIGDNKSVTLNFSSQIGGPNDTDSGFFMEGIFS